MNVTLGVPVPIPVLGMSGQACKATGKFRQFEGSEHMFNVKLVNSAPRQIRIR